MSDDQTWDAREAAARAEAEERDRREWLDGVKLRLGLVVAGDPPPSAVEWPAGIPDGPWETVSVHTLELPGDWPQGCRCVLSDGVRVSLGGPCPAHPNVSVAS